MEYSEVESNRFNLNVYRAANEGIDQKKIKSYIIEKKIDLLILRLPSHTKVHHYQLAKIGFDYIHADSLVYYTTDIKNNNINLLKNDLKFVIVNNDNVHVFDEIIPVIFKGYQNHYYSNPILDQQKVNAGYIEWAKSYSNKNPKKISWLIYLNEKMAGFATCAFDEKTSICEGILYGVMPGFSGKGIYTDIIRFTKNYFKGLGFGKMKVSTQIQNYAVQKVWNREGFNLTNSYETYHINALLSYSKEKPIITTINISEKELKDYAEFSKDFNEIHFNSDFAKKVGFKDRIVHGMIVLSHISKIIGTEYPGLGSIFGSNNNIFLAPIYLNETYTLEISTLIKKANGLHTLLFKVMDYESKLCLLSYNTVLKR